MFNDPLELNKYNNDLIICRFRGNFETKRLMLIEYSDLNSPLSYADCFRMGRLKIENVQSSISIDVHTKKLKTTFKLWMISLSAFFLWICIIDTHFDFDSNSDLVALLPPSIYKIYGFQTCKRVKSLIVWIHFRCDKILKGTLNWI